VLTYVIRGMLLFMSELMKSSFYVCLCLKMLFKNPHKWVR